MHLSVAQSRSLPCLFGLLAEDLAEREVRERVGHEMLGLLRADYFASFVWNGDRQRFGGCVTLNMNAETLRSYDEYYQFHDPITYTLQARRVPTLVNQVMPQRELMRTEFFNDFLARDGLHWGVNMYIMWRGATSATCASGAAAGDLSPRELAAAHWPRRSGDPPGIELQRFGAGRRPNTSSNARPMPISLRSLPAGPSSSRPTGSRLVAPSAMGICRPGSPALLPGSAFWM